VNELYRAYLPDLVALSRQMGAQRERIVSTGYRADFADRESEVLYLLVRALRPAVVVEMSPCHGYSTNYILAALTENGGAGQLHSYEITTEERGKPIERVIRDNLLPGIDANRLTLHIGDATKMTMPACDFAFIDSNHEAWFAAWYMQHLVAKAGVCLVHDILIKSDGCLVPKAALFGIREACYVLESLAQNEQRCIAVCDLEISRDGVHSRYPALDRSIVFAGNPPLARTLGMHEQQRRVMELALLIHVGDRISVIDEAIAMIGAAGPFMKIAIGLLFPQLGYRIEHLRAMYPVVYEGIYAAIDRETMTVPVFNAALELGARLYAPQFMAATLAEAKRSKVNRETIDLLYSEYRAQSYQAPHVIAHALNRARRLANRFRSGQRSLT
jgi:predicted O-methyltransferase YrrM